LIITGAIDISQEFNILIEEDEEGYLVAGISLSQSDILIVAMVF
jgi:hypothetical protein